MQAAFVISVVSCGLIAYSLERMMRLKSAPRWVLTLLVIGLVLGIFCSLFMM